MLIYNEKSLSLAGLGKDDGNGVESLKMFIKELTKELYLKMERYGRFFLQKKGFEPAFGYGETQTNFYIASVIDDLCGSIFMFENKITRKKSKQKGKFGRLDCWCHYDSDPPITLMIELKQTFIRFDDNNEIIYDVKDNTLHYNAIDQIEKIEDADYYCMEDDKNLFGVALSVLPIYVPFRDKEKNENDVDLNNDQWNLENMFERCNKIVQEVNYKDEYKGEGYESCCVGFLFPEDLASEKVECEIAPQYMRYQSYPGVLLLWTIKRIDITW